MTSGPRSHKPYRDEGGAVAVTVAVMLLMFVSIAALAIDAGSLWVTRRSLIADTDASALAAALQLRDTMRTAACTQAAAETAATDLLADNDPTSNLLAIDFSPDAATICAGAPGNVTVEANNEALTVFAPALGLTPDPVYSSSTAEVGPIVTPVGLRPIGVCATDPPYAQWAALASGSMTTAAYNALKGVDDPAPATNNADRYLDGWVDYPSYAAIGGQTGVVHRIPRDRFWKEGDSNCVPPATGQGDWGWILFGHDPPNNIDNRWNNGWDHLDLGSGDCDARDAAIDLCDPSGGNQPSAATMRQYMCVPTVSTQACIDQGKYFHILVYDAYSNPPNPGFRPVSIVGVILRDCDLQDPKAGGGGKGGGPGGGNPNNFKCVNSPPITYADNNASLDGTLPPGGKADKAFIALEFVDVPGEGGLGSDPNAYPDVFGVRLCDVDHATGQCLTP